MEVFDNPLIVEKVFSLVHKDQNSPKSYFGSTSFNKTSVDALKYERVYFAIKHYLKHFLVLLEKFEFRTTVRRQVLQFQRMYGTLHRRFKHSKAHVRGEAFKKLTTIFLKEVNRISKRFKTTLDSAGEELFMNDDLLESKILMAEQEYKKKLTTLLVRFVHNCDFCVNHLETEDINKAMKILLKQCDKYPFEEKLTFNFIDYLG